MRQQLRAEFLKQRTTRTVLGMTGAVVALVLAAMALHAFGLPQHDLAGRSDQLGIFIDVGENLGSLFAALIGAMAITGEIRHGTIRPTLLTTPQRRLVIRAKAIVAGLTGAALGALATSLAAGAGTGFLNARGITVHVDAANYALLIVGGATAAALWAIIGLGIGALIRNQAPVIVGLLIWVLFVENTIASSVPSVGKYAPATLGRAVAGATHDTLTTPIGAALLLLVYAAAAIVAGIAVTARRDFA